ELLPGLNLNRDQAHLVVVETFNAVEIGHADQTPVGRIRPAVIAALEVLTTPRALRNRPSAVAADIVEASQLSVLSANDHDRFSDHIVGEVSARFGHLIEPSDELPRAVEYPALLQAQVSGVRVTARGQSLRAFDSLFKIEVQQVHFRLG